jgi:hypothetical protein
MLFQNQGVLAYEHGKSISQVMPALVCAWLTMHQDETGFINLAL